MGVVIFLIMCKKCIIKQLTSMQPPFCNKVTYSVLIEQLRKFVPQERLFTCYTWLISSSRSRPIWIHRMLHVQDTGELGPCADSGRKPKVKNVRFQTRTFFLILKPFFFLCCAYLLFHFPVLNMTGFTFSKFIFICNMCFYKMRVYHDLNKA